MATFVSQCLTCQKVKIKHMRPTGLLWPLDIPEWKSNFNSMDFVVGLPHTQSGYDSSWVVISKLTKSAHFLPVRTTYNAPKLAKLFIKEIVILHGVPHNKISDTDPKFTFMFSKVFQKSMETRLHLNTAYHPQTNGQIERTIQTLKHMLMTCILEDGGSWDSYLPLMEFADKNSYHASIGMVPYVALYIRKCITPLCWSEVGDNGFMGPKIIQETTKRIKIIKDNLRIAQSWQKTYTDHMRRPLEFEETDHVFLMATPTVGIGKVLKVKKLNPCFVGPFQIMQRITHSS